MITWVEFLFRDSLVVLWRPRFLFNHNSQSTLLTVVKSRSNWVLTSKTSPTNLNDPIDQVNTHAWSHFGQIHGQTLPKLWCPWMSSGTFASFSKLQLNTSKSTNMKVAQFVEGHNFHVGWHFQFWVEGGGNLGQLSATPVHWHRLAFKLWLQFMQKLLGKIL
jgi:hypothetical protein